MIIDKFDGDFAFLSNFAPCAAFVGGTLEHEYQAAKTRDPGERRAILSSPTPGRAKNIGRRCTLRPDWNQVKDDVMLALLRRKFTEPHLRKLLLATGDAELVEGNTWNDTYWGVCQGKGLNRLGVLLMEVRRELRDGEL